MWIEPKGVSRESGQKNTPNYRVSRQSAMLKDDSYAFLGSSSEEREVHRKLYWGAPS